MFKIGDFSKLSRVSVKALRYYDEVALLKPAQVEERNGYRYYSADQLPRLNRILALKDLDFSLDQIAGLLDKELPADQIRGMLLLKQAELQQRMQEDQARLARVEARLKQIEEEGVMPTYEVVLKKVPAIRVASIRNTIPTYSQQAHLWGELEAPLKQHKIQPKGPCFTLYHDTEYRERDVDAEVCEPVETAARGNGPVTTRDLPAVEKMASVVHHGSFSTIGQAYTTLLKWIEDNGYRIIGPNREVCLHIATEGPVRQDDPSYVIEIQFPVQKIHSPARRSHA
jgi:effector-binding domain-containing protein